MRKKLVLGVIVVILLFMGIKFLFFNKIGNIMYVYDNETCQSSIYLDDKLIGQVHGEVNIKKNMDNTCCYLYTRHVMGCCSDNSGKDAVYYLKGDDIVLVGENMKLVSVATHSKEALLIDKNEHLYKYDGSNLLQISDSEIGNAVISGNGKYYAYYAYGNSFFGTKPEDEVIVQDVMIRYISNNAECIYAFDAKEGTRYYDVVLGMFGDNSILYSEQPNMYIVDKEGEKELVAKEITNVVCLNNDGKKIMFATKEGTFILKNGKILEQISEKEGQSAYYNVNNKNKVDDYATFKSFDGVLCCLTDKEYNVTLAVFEDDVNIKEVFSDNYIRVIELAPNNKKAICGMHASNGSYDYYMVDVKNGTVSLIVDSDSYKSCMDVESEYFYYFNGDVNKNNVGVVNFNCSLYYIDDEGNEKTVEGTFGDVKSIISYKDGCFVKDSEGIHYVEGKHTEKLDEFDGIVGFFKSDKEDTMYAYDESNVYKVNRFKLKKLEGEFENIEFGVAID